MVEELTLVDIPFPCTHCNSLAVYLERNHEGWNEEFGNVIVPVLDEHPHCRTCGTAWGSVEEYRDSLIDMADDAWKYRDLND